MGKPVLKTFDRIVLESLKLFNEQGERTVTTNHIAAHLGISPGNLYYHFKNKDEIVYHIFLRYEAFIDTHILPPNQREATLDDLFLYLRNAFLGMWRYRFLFADLPYFFSRNEELRKRYQTFFLRNIVHWQDLFRTFRAQGILDAGDDAIEHLAYNSWQIIKFWLPFYISSHPVAEASQDSYREGVYRALALFEPYIVPAYRDDFGQRRRVYAPDA